MKRPRDPKVPRPKQASLLPIRDQQRRETAACWRLSIIETRRTALGTPCTRGVWAERAVRVVMMGLAITVGLIARKDWRLCF